MVTRALRVTTARNARLAGRLARCGDDSGSIMFALLLMFLATALAGLMTPMLLVAINGTRSDQTRVTAVAAAQAGIDVAMGQIRAANDGTTAVIGVLAQLPCGTLSGSVSVANPARYQVSVAYYTTDPRGQNASWLSSNVITCIVGAGARNAPAYALLISQGTDQASGAYTTANSRTVQATYIFQSTNANIAGGLIHVYKTSTSTDLCIDAGSGAPAVGTAVTMRPCSPGSSQQTWAYNDDLTLELVSSVTVAQPTGVCLDAGTPESAGLIVKVQACGTTKLPQQEWSLNDSANFNGTSDGSTLNNLCFNVQTQNVSGSLIVLSTNCGDSYDNIETFSPEASVGAGAAGTLSGQLVNFSQFGRCLDIPNYDTGAGYMIAWPCKQAPVATNVGWNQRWSLPAIGTNGVSAPGKITTSDPGNPGVLYCLSSPASASPGQYVSMIVCPTGSPSNVQWTVYGATTAYSTGYRIIDGSGTGSGTGVGSTNGLCLQPADQASTYSNDFFSSGNLVMKLLVQVCNGSTLQKWNAPPNILSPLPLKDIGEK